LFSKNFDFQTVEFELEDSDRLVALANSLANRITAGSSSLHTAV
jgi:hypothetical protein